MVINKAQLGLKNTLFLLFGSEPKVFYIKRAVFPPLKNLFLRGKECKVPNGHNTFIQSIHLGLKTGSFYKRWGYRFIPSTWFFYVMGMDNNGMFNPEAMTRVLLLCNKDSQKPYFFGIITNNSDFDLRISFSKASITVSDETFLYNRVRSSKPLSMASWGMDANSFNFCST